VSFEIEIRDNGVGMSAEGASNLFMNFGKLDENAKRNRKGTGLGLSICKKIIEAMGGSVGVHSQLGQGTSFFIKLRTKCLNKPLALNDNLHVSRINKWLAIKAR
jgi:two-component system sensor histidine kinase/response regulator